ncbi:MAG: redoxin domain-containing protein [Planctomycetaceae bacterium]|nr:redoxin domain-containing protein [Planctomycetaceae bacterium]
MSERLHLSARVLIAGAVVASLLGMAASPAAAAKIGSSAPNLEFKDIRCLTRNLSDLGDAKGYALVFLNTTCPVAQRYLPRLEELHKKYAEQGIQLVGVYNSQDETPKDIAAHGLAAGLSFPIVWDEEQKCTKDLGVQRVPQAVLLDGAKRVVYSGRIDDQYRTGGVQPRVGRHDLVEAIDELLAGKSISVAETPVDGCKVTPWREPKFDYPVTYHEHVEPILQKRCQSCHHEGAAVPFGLVGYDEAKAQAEAIVEVTRDGRMPPWYAAAQFGHFSNDPTMSREERDLIEAWVDSGMPVGDSSKAPKPLEFAKSAWRIGEPDLVLTMKKPHKIEATGFIPYKYIFIPPAFTEDTYVEAIEIRPHNRAVVHHCNAFYVDAVTMKAGTNTFITGYVPGGMPFTLTPGLAQRIPKNSVIGLQIHYVTTGKEEESTISIGFRYSRDIVQKTTRFMLIDPRDMAIPPGDAFYEMKGRKKFEKDSTLIGLFTHMHLRGRDMTFNAHYPDGKMETLLQVPNFNFEWQLGYVCPQPPHEKKIPAGTEMEAIAHYDNSKFNPYNPDPKYTVPYGDQSYDEMFNGFIFYVHDEDNLNLKIDPKTGHVQKDEVTQK